MAQQDADRGWFGRNWGWCLGCGCLLPVLTIGAIITTTVWTAKSWIGSNSAIQTAMKQIRSDPRAVDALGVPIEPRVWRDNTSFNVRIGDDDDATMDTTITIEGPRGEARVEIEAHRPGGTDAWQLDRLLLYLNDVDEPIDLLEAPAPGAPDAATSTPHAADARRDLDTLAVA